MYSPIKPINAEVYLVYRCPNCECEWTKTPKEVIKLKGMVCDGCQTFVKFAPIARVRVIPKYKKQVIKKNHPLTDMQANALAKLVDLGFPEKEGREFVAQYSFTRIDDYVQAAIRKGTK